MRPVSEKNAEILFTRFFLQSFSLGSVQLYAPTSFEEFQNGYDAKFVGFSDFRELYLQFKAPSLSEARDRFTISATPHQHRLLKEYPPRGAYYVAPMFRSLAELNAAQSGLQSSAEFLRNFVCIEIAPLPTELDFFHYIRPPSHRESPQVKFKQPSDGNTRTASHPASSLRGISLLAKFKSGEIGAHCTLPSIDAEAAKGRLLGQSGQIRSLAEALKTSEYGILVRMPSRSQEHSAGE